MIDKNVVKRLVEEWLAGKEYFLVDVQVGTDDRIVVEIDHADGVWVDDCADLSRYIEDHLSRDEEDYELEVGSTGLGQPFKVPQQYVNNIGNEVEVLTQESEGHAQGRGNPAFHGLRAGESKGRGQEASRDDGRGLRLRHE